MTNTKRMDFSVTENHEKKRFSLLFDSSKVSPEDAEDLVYAIDEHPFDEFYKMVAEMDGVLLLPRKDADMLTEWVEEKVSSASPNRFRSSLVTIEGLVQREEGDSVRYSHRFGSDEDAVAFLRGEEVKNTYGESVKRREGERILTVSTIALASDIDEKEKNTSIPSEIPLSQIVVKTFYDSDSYNEEKLYYFKKETEAMAFVYGEEATDSFGDTVKMSYYEQVLSVTTEADMEGIMNGIVARNEAIIKKLNQEDMEEMER